MLLNFLNLNLYLQLIRGRDAKSPAFKSGQSWRLKFFPLVLRLMIENFRKLSFGTPFNKFSPA
jgi:hypothetical protein